MVSLSFATGCAGIGIIKEAPPPAPPQTEPNIPDLPTAPPYPGLGRVVLDAEGGAAKVSRVVAKMNVEARESPSLNGTTTLAPARMEEDLCTTPCAIDIRHGHHTFVFRAPNDPYRSSTADVTLPTTSKTMFVRHAVGKEGHMDGGYVGGAMLGLLGTGVTLLGGTVTLVGAFGTPTAQDDGTVSDPGRLLLPGLITLGVGLAMALGGGLIMANNRPVQQAGSTTTWAKPGPAAAGERVEVGGGS